MPEAKKPTPPSPDKLTELAVYELGKTMGSMTDAKREEALKAVEDTLKPALNSLINSKNAEYFTQENANKLAALIREAQQKDVSDGKKPLKLDVDGNEIGVEEHIKAIVAKAVKEELDKTAEAYARATQRFGGLNKGNEVKKTIDSHKKDKLTTATRDAEMAAIDESIDAIARMKEDTEAAKTAAKGIKSDMKTEAGKIVGLIDTAMDKRSTLMASKKESEDLNKEKGDDTPASKRRKEALDRRIGQEETAVNKAEEAAKKTYDDFKVEGDTEKQAWERVMLSAIESRRASNPEFSKKWEKVAAESNIGDLKELMGTDSVTKYVKIETSFAKDTKENIGKGSSALSGKGGRFVTGAAGAALAAGALYDLVKSKESPDGKPQKKGFIRSAVAFCVAAVGVLALGAAVTGGNPTEGWRKGQGWKKIPEAFKSNFRAGPYARGM